MRRAAAFPLLACLLCAAPARADVLLPPAGRVFAGLTGGLSADAFALQTGRRPPVFQFFTHVRFPLHPARRPPVFQFFTNVGAGQSWPFARAAAAGARPMLHVSTTNPSGREIATPRDIARGAQDRWLLGLNDTIAASGAPTYVRLMSEMNGHWNAYSAYGANGRRRNAAHSTAAFRAAWRRVVLLVRGGSVARID